MVQYSNARKLTLIDTWDLACDARKVGVSQIGGIAVAIVATYNPGHGSIALRPLDPIEDPELVQVMSKWKKKKKKTAPPKAALKSPHADTRAAIEAFVDPHTRKKTKPASSSSQHDGVKLFDKASAQKAKSTKVDSKKTDSKNANHEVACSTKYLASGLWFPRTCQFFLRILLAIL